MQVGCLAALPTLIETAMRLDPKLKFLPVIFFLDLDLRERKSLKKKKLHLSHVSTAYNRVAKSKMI